jgi:hypothetical protein
VKVWETAKANVRAKARSQATARGMAGRKREETRRAWKVRAEWTMEKNVRRKREEKTQQSTRWPLLLVDATQNEGKSIRGKVENCSGHASRLTRKFP